MIDAMRAIVQEVLEAYHGNAYLAVGCFLVDTGMERDMLNTLGLPDTKYQFIHRTLCVKCPCGGSVPICPLCVGDNWVSMPKVEMLVWFSVKQQLVQNEMPGPAVPPKEGAGSSSSSNYP